MKLHAIAVAAAIAALAALSLALPFAPVYDPFGWLVWGREITDLDLDTGAGPSWKPLPVIFTTAFAPAGDGAPELWLFVARSGWIAAAVLAAVLAAKLVPHFSPGERWAAGALAAAGVLLLDDSFTSWARQFAGGLAEPLLVALVLGAVERGLAGRFAQAYALGVAAALLRPEAWPLLGAFAIWLWRGARRPPRDRRRRRRDRRPLGCSRPRRVGLAADRSRARSRRRRHLDRRGNRGGWPRVQPRPRGPLGRRGYRRRSCWRERDRWVGLIAVLAAAWIAVVASMAMVGFAGLPRFAAPAAALVCVLGAAATVGSPRRCAAPPGSGASSRPTGSGR